MLPLPGPSTVTDLGVWQPSSAVDPVTRVTSDRQATRGTIGRVERCRLGAVGSSGERCLLSARWVPNGSFVTRPEVGAVARRGPVMWGVGGRSWVVVPAGVGCWWVVPFLVRGR